MSKISNPITDSRGEPLDVTQLETSALNELATDHYAKATELRDNHLKANDGKAYAEWKADDWELYVKHQESVDVLAQELQRRKEIDARGTKSFAPYAGMPTPDYGSTGAIVGGRALAEGFIKSEGYQLAHKEGIFRSNNQVPSFGYEFDGPGLLASLGRKSVVYTATGSGGGFIVPEFLPGFQGTAKQTPDLLSLISRGKTSTDTIHWMRQDSWTQAATAVAEATATTGTSGTKPEGGLGFSRQTTPVSTIAVWMPVTNQMLQDSPQIQSIIENHLLLDLQLELDNQILNGSGTGENFTGILNAGIQTVGMSTSFNNTMDAILRGITLIQTGDLRDPNVIVMNPVDFEQIRVLRSDSATAGAYLMGPPSESGAITLWGKPIVSTVRMANGTALVGDFQSGAMLWDRESSTIRVGLINDYLVRNMQVVLAELRAALTVFRPNAFCRVTGV